MKPTDPKELIIRRMAGRGNLLDQISSTSAAAANTQKRQAYSDGGATPIRRQPIYLLISGDFPTDPDACGWFVDPDGIDFGDGELIHEGAVWMGRLMNGKSAMDGSHVFAGGAGRINDLGMQMLGLRYAIQQIAEANGITRIGMLEHTLREDSDEPVWCFTYMDTPAASLVDGTFEVDFTGWTEETETDGTFSIETDNPISGAGSAKFTVSALSSEFSLLVTGRLLVDDYTPLRMEIISKITAAISPGGLPAEVSIQWFDDPAAGSVIRWDQITINPTIAGNKEARTLNPPKGAQSVTVRVRDADLHLPVGESFLFDDFVLKPVTVNHQLYLNDKGLWLNVRAIPKTVTFIPLLKDFTWRNYDAANSSAVDSAEGIFLTAKALAGVNLRILKKDLPAATPYTLKAWILPQIYGEDFNSCGVCWRYYSPGPAPADKTITFNIRSATAQSTGFLLCVEKYDTPTSAPVVYTSAKFVPHAPICLKLQDNGVSRIASWSLDGVNFTTFHTVARTDYVTANEIGFFASSQNASYPASVILQSWEYSEP